MLAPYRPDGDNKTCREAFLKQGWGLVELRLQQTSQSILASHRFCQLRYLLFWRVVEQSISALNGFLSFFVAYWRPAPLQHLRLQSFLIDY
jgi:hypothetical protein